MQTRQCRLRQGEDVDVQPVGDQPHESFLAPHLRDLHVDLWLLRSQNFQHLRQQVPTQLNVRRTRTQQSANMSIFSVVDYVVSITMAINVFYHLAP